jgi:predicted Rossmann-fold nucleotide-binding protein
LAQTLAKGFVENGFMFISGVAGGIMKAANCRAGTKNSFGLNIKLPHEQKANSYIRDSTHLMKVK